MHYTIQKPRVSIIIIIGKSIIGIHTFILHGCFKVIKSDDKRIYNVTKDLLDSSGLSLHQRNLKLFCSAVFHIII